jgi:hypothetical protein
LRRRSCSTWRRSRTSASRSGDSSIASPSVRDLDTMSSRSASRSRADGRPARRRATAVEGHERPAIASRAPPSPERMAAAAAASRCAVASARTDSSASRRSSSSGSSIAAASSSSTWNRSRSISRARARSSPPSAASAASISVSRHGQRAADRGRSPNSSSAARCVVGRQERLVCVLSVQVDDVGRDLGERCNGGQTVRRRRRAIGPSAGTTRVSTVSAPSGSDQPSVDAGFSGSRGAPSRRRPARRRAARSPRRASSCRRPSHRSPRSVRGPRTSSTRSITPRFSMCSSVSIGRTSVPLPVGEAELGLQDLVVALVPRSGRSSRSRRRRAGHDIAVVERRDRLTVERQFGGRWPVTSISITSVGSSTSVRSNSMCGDTGVSSIARWRGDTIGPRADSE